MKEVEFLLDKQVTKNLSRTDFSLKELAELDHPFATRHGKVGTPVYNPYWMVHKRSGKLLSSKQSGTIKASVSTGTLKATAFVLLDPAVAKHALHVVFGTSRMIPRPVLAGSGEQVAGKSYELLRTKLKNLTIAFKAR